MPIVISGLSKAFGEKQVLENFSCTLPAPGLTALMGPSGVGKTTLFRILLGLEKPDSGVIFGMEGKTLSVVFQADRLFPDLTVLQNAEVAGTNGEAWLARLGLQSELSAYPQSLSGGMRRRVSIARAICRNGDVFLLDEPFQGLDRERKRDVMEIFRQLKKEKPVLLITHDPEEADFLADQVLFLGSDEKTS